LLGRGAGVGTGARDCADAIVDDAGEIAGSGGDGDNDNDVCAGLEVEDCEDDED
jgi:hypothetical protein